MYKKGEIILDAMECQAIWSVLAKSGFQTKMLSTAFQKCKWTKEKCTTTLTQVWSLGYLNILNLLDADLEQNLLKRKS